MSREYNTIFVLAGRGQKFSLKDVILEFVDERVSKVFGVNINKLDTYSVHMDAIDIVHHEIPALEKLAELHHLLGDFQDFQITEEFTQIKPSDAEAALARDQQDYLTLYSLDHNEDPEAYAAQFASDRECKTKVTYVCAPDVKGLTVDMY